MPTPWSAGAGEGVSSGDAVVSAAVPFQLQPERLRPHVNALSPGIRKDGKGGLPRSAEGRGGGSGTAHTIGYPSPGYRMAPCALRSQGHGCGCRQSGLISRTFFHLILFFAPTCTSVLFPPISWLGNSKDGGECENLKSPSLPIMALTSLLASLIIPVCHPRPGNLVADSPSPDSDNSPGGAVQEGT